MDMREETVVFSFFSYASSFSFSSYSLLLIIKHPELVIQVAPGWRHRFYLEEWDSDQSLSPFLVSQLSLSSLRVLRSVFFQRIDITSTSSTTVGNCVFCCTPGCTMQLTPSYVMMPYDLFLLFLLFLNNDSLYSHTSVTENHREFRSYFSRFIAGFLIFLEFYGFPLW